jgi:uncharacterized protein (DUF1501 family)
MIDRRRFLGLGATGLASSLAARYAERFAFADAAARVPASSAKAKAVVVLWLNGGPSHLDTFDPKPGTPVGGPFKAIKTRAPSILLSEHLPQLAEKADKIAVVRSMSSKEGNHARAQYLLHTGYSPNPTVVHPSLGGWVCEQLGDPQSDIPTFVSIGGPSFGAGFLGVQNGPFVLQKAGEMPPNVEPPPQIDAARFDRRKAALDFLEKRFASQTGDAKVDGREAVYAKAVRMMRSPRIDVFDLGHESDATKKAYGDTDFGRGCLLARRLVERGVKFTEVVLDGWDTHKDNFNRNAKQMGILDPAFATLLGELDQRKLLRSTIVVCMGDFGRTPKINGNEGRDHHPQAWSAVLAGGGIRGGYVHGTTDADGDKVAGPATSVPDLMATLATLMGMDPTHSETTPAGRPIAITEDGVAVKALLAQPG